MIRVIIISILVLNTIFASSFKKDFVKSAINRIKHFVLYNGSYFSINYPNGDIPKYFGVCTDVIIRSYRAMNIDLQQLVHKDMKANFSAYPSKKIWGLSKTDKNIDHKRVPNLQSFFSRHGKILIISKKPKDYKAGDLVTWILPNNSPHIGIITNKISHKIGNPLVVHNIGYGPEMNDMLFKYKITGHYKYAP